MISAHSTVPRWSADPPPADRSGRSYVVVAFGAEAQEATEGWCDEIGEGVLLLAGSDSAATLAQLQEFLESACNGLRLMVAGPEQDVLMAQSIARAAGMIDAELTLHVTSADRRRVYCVHCKTTSSVAAAVEEVATCEGCGRGLLVYAHFSRRSASFLGFLADAEKPA